MMDADWEKKELARIEKNKIAILDQVETQFNLFLEKLKKRLDCKPMDDDGFEYYINDKAVLVDMGEVHSASTGEFPHAEIYFSASFQFTKLKRHKDETSYFLK